MSQRWKFDVTWRHTCLACHNPLDVMINLTTNRDIKLFWERYANYTTIRPSKMYMNRITYKIINMKAHKMCSSCYDAKVHNVNIKSLMDRDTYGKRIRPRSESLNAEQIYDWFEAFTRYLRRPDAGDYIGTASNDVLVG